MAVGDSAPRSRSRRQWVRIPPKGRIFSKEGTSAGPWMCVYVYQGLTLGWWKEERRQQGSNPMDVVCCCIRVVSSRKKRREKVGVGGPPPHHRKK
jgi:hypothetical protein